MDLKAICANEKKLKQLQSKNIITIEDLLSFYPKKYRDFRIPKTLNNVKNNENCLMILEVREIKKSNKFVKLIGREDVTRNQVSVIWFQMPYKYKEVCNLVGFQVAVGGKFTEDKWEKQFINPEIFTTDIASATKIYPIYSNIKGMSQSYIREIINKAINIYKPEEFIPEDIRNAFRIISEDKVLQLVHTPTCPEDVQKANKRIVFDELYQFARKMINDSNKSQRVSTYIPHLLKNCNRLIREFPYELTDDQKKVISSFVNNAKKGKRINALIQGDVGCGKTVCAFLLMLAMSDNGYQSVLMAPTGVLAKQHYNELKGYVEPMGLSVAYLSGELKAKEKNEILNKIKDGEVDFIVGTHSVISDNVEFKNLGLTVVDEEHKFGVIQRESLQKKADKGVHNITMSATPIPRSLAMVLYGEAMDIHTISTMPNGRKPVKTAIVKDDNSVFRFMETEIKAGHQCYIVCPLIENDDSDGEKPASVDEVYKKVSEYFEIRGNIKAEIVTGKMKDTEKSEIIERFKANETQILIATTIIEVGVNVPNATVITIMNAERFGLAGLHQLRGRVGRGKLQSYCILKSNEIENERLLAMIKTTNGFEIAEEDLKLRGAGDFIGTKQSGNDKSVELMLRFPKFYESIKNYVIWREENDNAKDTKLQFN